MSQQLQKLNSADILCSAGKGRMSKEACLDCALKLNNLCGYDYALLNSLFVDKAREGIHVTDLTGCLRRTYYDKTSPEPEYPHQMLSRWLGTAVHKHIESVSSDEYENEKPLAAHGLVGTADIVYKNGRLVDTKTSRWLKAERLPYGSHEQQLNLYAAMLREQGVKVTSAAIQYIDLSGPSKCGKCKGPAEPDATGIMTCTRCGRPMPNGHTGAMLVEVELFPQEVVVEQIQIRRAILETHLEGNTTPEAEESFLCDYCAFRQRCSEE